MRPTLALAFAAFAALAVLTSAYPGSAGGLCSYAAAPGAMGGAHGGGNGQKAGLSVAPAAAAGTYTINMAGVGTYKGLDLWVANAVDGTHVGSLTCPGGFSYNACGANAQATIQHSSNAGKTTAAFTWTAGALAPGTYVAQAVVVVSINNWYTLTPATFTVAAAAAPAPAPAPATPAPAPAPATPAPAPAPTTPAPAPAPGMGTVGANGTCICPPAGGAAGAAPAPAPAAPAPAPAAPAPAPAAPAPAPATPAPAPAPAATTSGDGDGDGDGDGEGDGDGDEGASSQSSRSRGFRNVALGVSTDSTTTDGSSSSVLVPALVGGIVGVATTLAVLAGVVVYKDKRRATQVVSVPAPAGPTKRAARLARLEARLEAPRSGEAFPAELERNAEADTAWSSGPRPAMYA